MEEVHKKCKNATLHTRKTLRRRKQIGNTTSSGKYITKRGHDNLKAAATGFWTTLRDMPVYTRDQLRDDGLPIDYNQRIFIIDMINLVNSLPANSTSRLKERLQHQLERILPEYFKKNVCTTKCVRVRVRVYIATRHDHKYTLMIHYIYIYVHVRSTVTLWVTRTYI